LTSIAFLKQAWHISSFVFKTIYSVYKIKKIRRKNISNFDFEKKYLWVQGDVLEFQKFRLILDMFCWNSKFLIKKETWIKEYSYLFAFKQLIILRNITLKTSFMAILSPQIYCMTKDLQWHQMQEHYWILGMNKQWITQDIKWHCIQQDLHQRNTLKVYKMRNYLLDDNFIKKINISCLKLFNYFWENKNTRTIQNIYSRFSKFSLILYFQSFKFLIFWKQI
jgi:hypothetical protein